MQRKPIPFGDKHYNEKHITGTNIIEGVLEVDPPRNIRKNYSKNILPDEFNNYFNDCLPLANKIDSCVHICIFTNT